MTNKNSNLGLKASEWIGTQFEYSVNCFGVSQVFFGRQDPKRVSADEMLAFVATNFRQLGTRESNATLVLPVLYLVWSRASETVPIGSIEVQKLHLKEPGFPFGLVLEHSFVEFEKDHVFQKADPRLESRIEVLSLENAVQPYKTRLGFELTQHVCNHARPQLRP